MFFGIRYILEKLNDETISLEKRKKIFKVSKYIIQNSIYKLSSEELLEYLYKSNLDDEVKKIIYNEIVKLSEAFYSKDKEKYESIKEIFSEKYSKEGLLNSEFCNNDFKSLIIDKVFGEDLLSVVSKGSISLYKKKLIVDLKIRELKLAELLCLDLSDDIVNYIIEEKLKDGYAIAKCLNEKNISSDIKKLIVEKCVNVSNIFRVNHNLFSRSGIDLLSERKDLVDSIYNQIDSNNILDYFTEYTIPNDFRTQLFNKIDLLQEAIELADVKKIKSVFLYSYDKTLNNMLFNYRRDSFDEIINNLKKVELLGALNKGNVPDEFKELVIRKHKKAIIESIQKESFNDLNIYYLSCKVTMPQEVVNWIINLHYDDVLEYIKNIPENELLSKVKYSSASREIIKLILIHRFDDKKIFELLSSIRYDDDVVDLILETRQDFFINYFKDLSYEELFRLNGLKFVDSIKDKIVQHNERYLLNVIDGLSTEEKVKLLNDKEVNLICKSLLLSSLSVEKDDVNDFLVLLSNTKAEILMDNFNVIKEFIIDNDIDFKSLIQYGAGSKKHNLWMEKLIKIILENDKGNFIKCRKYFFDNYYDQFSNKENAVYEINCFLEMIDNYSKYRELIHNIVENNIILTDEDKNNLRFLFNLNVSDEIDVPVTLDELSDFKLKLYSDYIFKINNDLLSDDEIKKVFNDLLFCDSKMLLDDIGGTGALRVLKKDNCNNNDIVRLVDSLMLYGRVIEMVNDSNNIDGLKDVLKYVFSDIDALTKFQNLFSNFENKVSKLYEMDAVYNLTNLDEARLNGAIDYALSEQYGGEVFDFSDKNYALYAHVFSKSESIEELLNGIASGEKNFISVSPISYRGQCYYWGKKEMIFAYDDIPSGNFIRSSICNMGSNRFLNKNSSEVDKASVTQRGILESSSVVDNNAETLLYREGLRPCGLILPGGREPTKEEMEVYTKYNLPFIITQEVKKSIENVKYVFNNEQVDNKDIVVCDKEILEMIRLLEPKTLISKEDDEFTGREVAIFTDCHSMFEPTVAVLEDIRRHGISEIYSLGDNVGLGPNPCEVFDILDEYGVISVAGNSEYYNTLGIEPFDYFYEAKRKSQEWTERKLGNERIKKMKVYPASIDLVLGGEKLALCHFANDVRWDYRERSTHTYQAAYDSGNAAKQFLYTNSDLCKKKVNNCITSHKKGDGRARGYIASKEAPLFDGKLVTDYDAIIQGHVHFDREDEIEGTSIHTLRAVGMGYERDDESTACYYVLKEKKDGSFVKEKRLVKFNKNNLMASIYNSDIPNKENILRYVKK